MAKITTTAFLFFRIRNEGALDSCVDWAITMLEEGRDGHFLIRLAGMLPPHNPFELKWLYDSALREQGIPEPTYEAAVTNYAVELLGFVVAREADPIDSAAILKDLYMEEWDEFIDFFLLHLSYLELRCDNTTTYWPDATLGNINSIVIERAEQFLRKRPNGNSPTGS